MSKLWKKPINIPKDTKVKIESGKLTLTGPKGSKELTLNDKIFTTSLSNDNSLILNLIKKNEESKNKLIDNLSMENANYLQNLETNIEETNSEKLTSFEVESIEMATPQLFSNDDAVDNSSAETKITADNPGMFDDQISQENSEQKEPEMFDNSESEEDFEIPAFLRKQKD